VAPLLTRARAERTNTVEVNTGGGGMGGIGPGAGGGGGMGGLPELVGCEKRLEAESFNAPEVL